MQRWKYLLLLPLGIASFHASACYTVYDRNERVVYQSEMPPVDMSRPLHETLPARFPGGHMIFDASSECQVISSVASGMGAPTLSSRSPLLTEQRTAQAMNVPHIVLEGGVALVQQRDAVMAPGISVVPSSGVPNTSMMGAGPSRSRVITELRDPPVTIEQNGGRWAVRPSLR
ncbi:MAG TPA: hypothetical protein VLI46_07055 [Ramlibacter sp.]|nr:hypothetical protein [Ramlibacter sp.]